MPKGELPCFTSFNDEDGNNYRAHPCYDGKAWNDYAMIEWEGYPQPEPVFIHTFVDLRGLPKGDSIDINSNGQTKLTAGLYAVAHSFNPVDEGDLNTPNTLIGHYTPHFHSFNDRHPTLFLVDVESIRSPVLGIPDVQFGVKPPMNERHYLFLIRRKAEWPRAWDSLINRCHHDLEHDVDDDTWFEEEYEKDELINRLPSGRGNLQCQDPRRLRCGGSRGKSRKGCHQEEEGARRRRESIREGREGRRKPRQEVECPSVHRTTFGGKL
ncbi:hypothetical protein MHU86_9385 [Fragilaria crotonensis]|nr:hypothetical protein MHU86_9385 [Fragilaria crotonensis]